MPGGNFIKQYRSEESLFLDRHPIENHLLNVIAKRVQRTIKKTSDIVPGEALIGDYPNQGLTRQSYRTALKNLKNWNFVTTRTTTKGTIARLVDTRIYDLNCEQPNHQTNPDLTINPEIPNHQPNHNLTTNKKKSIKNDKKEEKNKRGSFQPPSLLEVRDFFFENNFDSDPEEFRDHFVNCGWRLSSGRGAVMKDWRLTAKSWNRRDERFKANSVSIYRKKDAVSELLNPEMLKWAEE